jgi:hypothetical protein
MDIPTEPEIITVCRAIVSEHQCQEIDGMLVDALTANMLTKVYDALNETNRAKFGTLTLSRMVAVGWSCIE